MDVEELKLLFEAYIRGDELQEIAERHGVSVRTVKRMVDKAGLPGRKKQTGRTTDETIAAAMKELGS